VAAQRLSLLQFGFAYGVALIALGLLDGVWLGVLARDFYRREMGGLMAESVRLGPAVLFYVLYPLGLVFFALQPAPEGLSDALWRCALLGALAYGTYDLSNLATVRGWSARLCVVDIAWGLFASAVAGGAAWRVALAGAART